MGRVFDNGQGNRGSMQGRVVPKTQKMVLDATLPNTQHYKVRIKVKVEQSRERSCTFPNTLVSWLLKRELQVALDYSRQLTLLFGTTTPDKSGLGSDNKERNTTLFRDLRN